MSVTLGDQIAQNVRQKTTEELLAIWVSNDRGQWSDTAFDAISQTLSERGVVIPPQAAFAPPPPPPKGGMNWVFFYCIGLALFSPAWVMLAAVSIWGGICLWQERHRVKKMGKVFLWCLVALSAIGSFRTYGGVNAQVLIVCIPGVFGLAAWLVYSYSSKRDKAKYETRG